MGKKYQTKCYDLDAIIAVGYRVNSKKATNFRIWATETLKEYITKGFVLDDELLKNKFPDEWKLKLEEYTNFFKKLPVAAKTDNGVFISHSGPPKNIKNIAKSRIKIIFQILIKKWLGNIWIKMETLSFQALIDHLFFLKICIQCKYKHH